MENNKIGQHISENFNKEIGDIHHQVLMLGGFIEHQIELCMRVFTTGDSEIAKQIIRQDEQVDSDVKVIDHECTQILALRQPAAFDLRMLISVIKIINELEVVGDLIKQSAKMTIRFDVDGRFDDYYELQQLILLVKRMLRSAMDAFARLDRDSMVSTIKMEDEVHKKYANIFRQLTLQMMEDPRKITRTLYVLQTANMLEHIGDHARYICQHVIYMMTGVNVRHTTPLELESKLN